jgi:hypothetical protein
MPESTVVFAPGCEAQTGMPFGTRAYTADDEVLVPISSTKTGRSGSIRSATVAL